MKAMLFLALTTTLTGGASHPAAAQSSPASNTPAPRSATPDRARRLQLQAQAQELEAERQSALVRLDRQVASLQTSLRALRSEEQRVRKSAAPRSRLRPLQARVTLQQREVRATETQLAEITQRQSQLRKALKQDNQQLAAHNNNLLTDLSNALRPAAIGEPVSTPRLDPLQRGMTFFIPSLTVLLARAEQEEQRAAAQLAAFEAALNTASDTLETSKRQFEAGLKPSDEVRSAENGVVKARSEFESARLTLAQRSEERERLARLAALQRPINVELRDATIRQAAQVIEQSAAIPVRVSDNVPADKRLTVAARGVPISSILDSIARQTGLLIAPHENGVSLEPTPSLKVNGQHTQYMSPYAPWSSDWGMNPATGYGLPISSSFPREAAPLVSALFSAGSTTPTARSRPATEQPAAVHAPPVTVYRSPDGTALYPVGPREATPVLGVPRTDFNQATPYYPGQPSVRIQTPRDIEYWVPGATTGSSPVSMFPLSESTFVVANPASAPGGEPAILLTVYRVEGGQIRIVSTMLHRLQAPGATRGGRSPAEEYGIRSRPTTPPSAAPPTAPQAR